MLACAVVTKLKGITCPWHFGLRARRRFKHFDFHFILLWQLAVSLFVAMHNFQEGTPCDILDQDVQSPYSARIHHVAFLHAWVFIFVPSLPPRVPSAMGLAASVLGFGLAGHPGIDSQRSSRICGGGFFTSGVSLMKIVIVATSC